ncbi:sulfite exporter TauE/SafE family protein [uncultured Methanobrevibacter sp.]|uniref:sulfite exporter TauE/SafE family protein n=1 Tax=uncultured Methanobrevibacter sp. TaxID=253161 RepID=UPI0025E90445|nr:sulfite exporter TauE/SafE family protein [uncultured Methanobrevibacter sp.]
MFTIEYFIGIILIGIVIGLLSGMLGVGGGILMVPFQYFLFSYIGIPPQYGLLTSLGTSLAIIIPTAISGAYEHSRKLDGIIPLGIKFGIFGIIGGFIGGIIAYSIPYWILQFIFALVLLLVMIKTIVSFKEEENKGIFTINQISICLTGLFVGISSGLLGIGGGLFLIGILTAVFGFTTIKAIGISSVFITLTAIGGTIAYIILGWGNNPIPYTIGFVSIINFIVICAFSVPFAKLGAKYAHIIPEKYLKILLLIGIIYIEIKILGFI